MGDIKRKIELFNRAYAVAWEVLSKSPANKRPSTALELAALIRSNISAGGDDADTIAADAIRIMSTSG